MGFHVRGRQKQVTMSIITIFSLALAFFKNEARLKGFLTVIP